LPLRHSPDLDLRSRFRGRFLTPTVVLRGRIRHASDGAEERTRTFLEEMYLMHVKYDTVVRGSSPQFLPIASKSTTGHTYTLCVHGAKDGKVALPWLAVGGR
jgi:hypothetical protein